MEVLKIKFLKSGTSLLILVLLIFLPKIDIIEIQGYWQGIRLEDILIACYAFYIFFSNYNNITGRYLRNFQYNGFYIFFCYLFFSNIMATLLDLPVRAVMIIRMIEYIFLLFLIDQLSISKIQLLRIFKLFLLINLVVVILQNYNFLGSISSLGYLAPSHFINQRALGILGGSWELSVVSTLVYYFIFKNEKKNEIKFIFFIITFYLVISSQSRTQTMAFFALITLLLFDLKNIRILFLMMFIILLSFLYIDAAIFNKIKAVDFGYIYELTYNLFINNEVPGKDDVINPHAHLSYWYRLNFWQSLYNEYLSNSLTILFGRGFYSIYTESLIIRIVFTSGIIGSLLLLYLLRKMDLIFFVYFGLAGLTLDLFISQKIFIMTLLILKNNFVNLKK